jgi:hypothetical protein
MHTRRHPDALVRAGERSSPHCGALLRRAGEGTRPYATFLVRCERDVHRAHGELCGKGAVFVQFLIKPRAILTS